MSKHQDQDQPPNRQPLRTRSSSRGKQPMQPPLRRHSSLKPPLIPDYHQFTADGKMAVATADQEDDVLIVQSPAVKRKFGTDRNEVALTDRSKGTKKALPSRQESSLAIFTKKFINLLMSAEDGILDLNEAASALNVMKRRLYDITNVLEGVGLIEKDSKSRIRWKGQDVSEPEEMNDEVTELQAEIESLSVEENSLDERIREMQERIKNLTEDDNNQKWLFATEDDIKSVPRFQNETLIAITAPHGTALEVPDPDEAGEHSQRRYRIILKSTMGPIDIYLLSQFEENFEDMSIATSSGFNDIPIAASSGSIDNPATSVADTGMPANAQQQDGHTMTYEHNIPQDSSAGITQIGPSGVNDHSDYWLFSDIDDVALTDMWNIDLDNIDWDGVDLLSDKFDLPDTDVGTPNPSDPPSDAPSQRDS